MRLSFFWTTLITAALLGALSAVVLIRAEGRRVVVYALVMVLLTLGAAALGLMLPPIGPATTIAMSVGIIMVSVAIILYVRGRAGVR